MVPNCKPDVLMQELSLLDFDVKKLKASSSNMLVVALTKAKINNELVMSLLDKTISIATQQIYRLLNIIDFHLYMENTVNSIIKDFPPNSLNKEQIEVFNVYMKSKLMPALSTFNRITFSVDKWVENIWQNELNLLIKEQEKWEKLNTLMKKIQTFWFKLGDSKYSTIIGKIDYPFYTINNLEHFKYYMLHNILTCIYTVFKIDKEGNVEDFRFNR